MVFELEGFLYFQTLGTESKKSIKKWRLSSCKSLFTFDNSRSRVISNVSRKSFRLEVIKYSWFEGLLWTPMHIKKLAFDEYYTINFVMCRWTFSDILPHCINFALYHYLGRRMVTYTSELNKVSWAWLLPHPLAQERIIFALISEPFK